MNIEQAKSIPLAEILDKMGGKPERPSGHDLYFKAPYRQENTASLHVNTLKNVWYDHGIGEGGDGINLTCKYLQSCGVSFNVPDALRWMGNMMGYAPIIKPIQNDEPPQDDRKLIVIQTQEIERPALVRYLESRGFPVPFAKQYLKQINVYNRQSKKSIFALGFKNDKGGYEVRNKFYQGSTKPKYITFIRGEVIKPPEIHLSEGWPDYLSAIIHKRDGRKFEGDTIVLNSLSNLTKATPYIKGYGYRTAYSWMDNDVPGKEATNNLHEFFKTEEELLHKPMNEFYAPCKDVNAWHKVKLGLAGSNVHEKSRFPVIQRRPNRTCLQP